MMDLSAFVSSVLTDIIDGVVDAQQKHLGVIVPPTRNTLEAIATDLTAYQTVAFEVLVTVEEGKESGGKIGVMAAFVGAKGEHSRSDSTRHATTIRFAVPVRFPETILQPQMNRPTRVFDRQTGQVET